MLKIKIHSDSKAIENKIKKASIAKVKNILEKELKDTKCEIHNQNPTIEITGQDLDNLGFEIKGCCEDFKKIVEEKISKAFHSSSPTVK